MSQRTKKLALLYVVHLHIKANIGEELGFDISFAQQTPS